MYFFLMMQNLLAVCLVEPLVCMFTAPGTTKDLSESLLAALMSCVVLSSIGTTKIACVVSPVTLLSPPWLVVEDMKVLVALALVEVYLY